MGIEYEISIGKGFLIKNVQGTGLEIPDWLHESIYIRMDGHYDNTGAQIYLYHA